MSKYTTDQIAEIVVKVLNGLDSGQVEPVQADPDPEPPPPQPPEEESQPKVFMPYMQTRLTRAAYLAWLTELGHVIDMQDGGKRRIKPGMTKAYDNFLKGKFDLDEAAKKCACAKSTMGNVFRSISRALDEHQAYRVAVNRTRTTDFKSKPVLAKKRPKITSSKPARQAIKSAVKPDKPAKSHLNQISADQTATYRGLLNEWFGLHTSLRDFCRNRDMPTIPPEFRAFVVLECKNLGVTIDWTSGKRCMTEAQRTEWINLFVEHYCEGMTPKEIASDSPDGFNEHYVRRLIREHFESTNNMEEYQRIADENVGSRWRKAKQKHA